MNLDAPPPNPFETIWNALPDPVLTFDAQGRLVEVNGAAEDFLGESQKHLEGRKLADFAQDGSRLTDLVGQVLKKGVQMAEYDVELSWPERPTRLVDLHGAPLDREAGGIVVMIHPRAIAATMDRSLNHRNAARSVAGMSSMLAHEVKNPLAGISGAAQLLEMNADEGDRELVELIRDEVARIAGLLQRVEQFGEIGPPMRQAVNIHDVLDRAVRSAKAGFAQHLRVAVDYDPSLPLTYADSDQLMQALQNLLKNAAEAAPQVGGAISVRTAYRAGMKVLTPAGRRESLPLEIAISDNGPGIPEDLQRHIFEPFVSSKSTGSGLGLALVSKIVADHGGVIRCESEQGWTRFRLQLPVASEETAPLRAAGEDAA